MIKLSISTREELEFKITEFLKLYKGTREVPLDEVMKNSIKEGNLTLRGFERVLVGTGVEVEVTDRYELLITGKTGDSLKKGLSISSQTIDDRYRGEVNIVITNNTPFLNTISIGDVIAQGTPIIKSEKP